MAPEAPAREGERAVAHHAAHGEARRQAADGGSLSCSSRGDDRLVLNNWRKHREHYDQRARSWQIDPFATGWSFDGWKEREGEPFVWKLRETYQPMPTWRPKTWLLSEGWRRYGLVSTQEVPGPRASVSELVRRSPATRVMRSFKPRAASRQP